MFLYRSNVEICPGAERPRVGDFPNGGKKWKRFLATFCVKLVDFKSSFQSSFVFLQPGKVLLPACSDQYSAQWEVLSGASCSHSSLLSATLSCQVQLCWSPGLSAPSHQLMEFTTLCLGSPSLHGAQKLSKGSKLGATLVLTSFSPKMASFFLFQGLLSFFS